MLFREKRKKDTDVINFKLYGPIRATDIELLVAQIKSRWPRLNPVYFFAGVNKISAKHDLAGQVEC